MLLGELMIRILNLALGALALAIAAGALPGPARAQEFPVTWVYQCSYTGWSEPSYASAHFSVKGTKEEDHRAQVKEAWKAWLGSNKPVRRPNDAECRSNPESAVTEIQREITVQGGERVTWIPDFAVPYQLPREVYYFCTEPEEHFQRMFVTDLFKAPMPENLYAYLEDARRKHERWLFDQGLKPYLTNERCSVANPEPYQMYAQWLDRMSIVRDLDRPYRLTRSAWPGIDPTAAPNLIDDLAARAKYAKLSIAPRPAVAKAAPPPSKPKAEGPPPKATQAGHLTVKEDTSAKDAAKAWDEQVKKALAAEAQKKVETAAKALRDDTEMKRKIAEFMAERRRQGAAQ